MKFFDIEEKIVGKPKIFDDLMFFLMKDIQAETGKKILGFFRLGDKKRIKIFLLEKLFDLFASSLIIKKRMFRIDINMDSPSVGHFLYSLEYFV